MKRNQSQTEQIASKFNGNQIQVDYCTRSLVESVEKIREDQQSYGNDALQVRVICSDEVTLLPCVTAYDALLSLAQTTDLSANQDLIEEIGLIVGQMMEERPAAVSVSSPATTRKYAVIGLLAHVSAIKDRLCGQSSKLQVIPIVGMGRIGKTTLARTVYDDPLILYHFDIRAWVTVSENYGPHKLRKILLGLVDSVKLLGKKLSREKINESGAVEVEEEQLLGERIEESEIALKVYQSLKGRRYLIVMDDIRRTYVWDDLRNVFPDDNNGSRIMLTTRRLHKIRFMDDHQSLDWLKQKAICHLNWKALGKRSHEALNYGWQRAS